MTNYFPTFPKITLTIQLNHVIQSFVRLIHEGWKHNHQQQHTTTYNNNAQHQHHHQQQQLIHTTTDNDTRQHMLLVLLLQKIIAIGNSTIHNTTQ